MVQFRVERVINVAPDRAWEHLGDFAHVSKIHPLVETVEQLTPNGNGLGAKRQCNMYDGNKVSERITAWSEECRQYSVSMYEGSLPVKAVDVTLSVHEVNGGVKSKLIADMSVSAKYGLIGKVMEVLVLKGMLGKAVGNLFAGIEYHNETGKDVQKGYRAATPALITSHQ